MPLAPLTTLKVGGPARFFVEAATEGQIAAAIAHAHDHGLDTFILGGGSNILVSDSGFDGLVINIGLKGISLDELKGSVTAQAGEDWDHFVAFCVDRDFAGIECLSGIPGFVGGTPVQNVGAYGQEVSESIVSVRCLDRISGGIVDLANSDCGFAYRTSIFNSSRRERYVVLAVTLSLEPGGSPKIVYKDLIDRFGKREPTLAETREAVISIRTAKSMVIDPDDPNSKSAGSFFKNPVIAGSDLSGLEKRMGVGPIPHFEAEKGKIKVPAAWLIERAGFHKGFALGNAGISSKHSLGLINRGGASAAEIVALKDLITAEVRSITGIDLSPEPIFVGFGK